MLFKCVIHLKIYQINVFFSILILNIKKKSFEYLFKQKNTSKKYTRRRIKHSFYHIYIGQPSDAS